MNFFNTIIDMLKNKKMYGLAAIIIAIGVIEGWGIYDIPGVDVGTDWMAWILAGLTTAAGKAAIAKT